MAREIVEIIEIGIFIVFRPHEQRIFHAYPVEINNIPANVRRILLSNIPDKGKLKRKLKAKR